MTYRWRFALLYFSEGAPIGFLWWAMPTLLRHEGVAVERIAALTATLALPWALKFLWAPLVDVLRGPRWGFRHWAMTAQIGMGLTLLPLCFVDPLEGFSMWVGLLVAHAGCAATQDVAIDALAVTTVPAAERGRVNGAMQLGMLVGRGAFAGGAIWLMARGGWALPVLALTTAVWVSMVILWTHPEKPVTEKSPQPWRQFKSTLGKVMVGPNTWIGIAFALVAGAGFEATGALAGPMLTDFGVPVATTGWFFALPVVVMMALGALGGGAWGDQGNRSRRLSWALAGMTALILVLAVVARSEAPSPRVVLVLLALVYGGIGVFTAISYAWFMDLTDSRLGATQFSTFMAATNGCEVWAVAVGGLLVARWDYGGALGLLALVGLTAILLLRKRAA